MFRVCPKKNSGLPSRIRPDGSRFEDHAGKRQEDTANLAAQCLLSKVEPHEEKVGREWLIDSGCNRHMTPHKEDLIDISRDSTVCMFGNGEKVQARGQGDVVLNCRDENGKYMKIMLQDVLYMPSLPHRMFSSGRLRERGGEFRERNRNSFIKLPASNMIIPLFESKGFVWLRESGHRENDTIQMIPQNTTEHRYEFKNNEVMASTLYAPGSRETAEASMLDWHEAFGHPHPASILFLEQRGLIKVKGLKNIDEFNCRICKESKSTTPHYQRGTRSIKRPGEVIHVDLVGPFEPDMNGYKYMMVFVDEATRLKSVLGLRNRGDTHKLLKTYTEGMQLSGVMVDCIRGDGAGELGRSRMFRQELKNLALRWESSPPYTHQQQGLVERV